LRNKPVTNLESPLYEVKYLGKGKIGDTAVTILIIFTGILTLSVPLYTKSKLSPLNDMIFYFVIIVPIVILIALFGLIFWHIWPKYVRFYNRYLEFIDRDAGPITSRKPVIVDYKDIINVEKTFDEDELLVYSKDFERTHGHQNIDLNGMTHMQKIEIIAQFQMRNIPIEKDSRMTMGQIIEIMEDDKSKEK